MENFKFLTYVCLGLILWQNNLIHIRLSTTRLQSTLKLQKIIILFEVNIKKKLSNLAEMSKIGTNV